MLNMMQFYLFAQVNRDSTG